MKHHGDRLRQLTKDKGFNMRELSEAFGVTRAAIEKHFKSERLTRRVLKPYADKFGFSLDGFFEEVNPARPSAVANDGNTEPSDLKTVLHYQAEIIASKEEIIIEQRKHIETLSNMLRFFPTALQRAKPVTA